MIQHAHHLQSVTLFPIMHYGSCSLNMSFLKYPDMIFLEGFSHMVLLNACCFNKQITVTVSV